MDFIRFKFWGGDGQAYLFLVRGFAFVRPTFTDFDSFGYHAKGRLAIGVLLHIKQNIDGDINATVRNVPF